MLADSIASFVCSTKFRDLTQDMVREAKRRIKDTVGVSFGALSAPPVRIARFYAEYTTSRYGASLLGRAGDVALEDAVFANGCAARYLDFNDTYLSKEAMHPSDNIPALIAVGEAEHASGADLLTAVAVSYEIACILADASSIRDRGWDHVTYIALSSAAGASKLMNLDEEKTVQAINLAAAPNVALRQTRSGELSMWKGCAAANAARNGVFAAVLAKHGMTGPSPIFEGEMGFFRQVSGEFGLRLEKAPGKLVETHIKRHPVEYHAMSAVDAALALRSELGDAPVRRVEIDTFTVAWKIIAKDQEKWDPKTKETADHSLPFLVDRALLDGFIWLDSYTEWKIRDPKVLELLKSTKVNITAYYDTLYPDAVPNRVTAFTDSGSYSKEVIYPVGHWKNPISDEELDRKYLKLGGPKDALLFFDGLERRSVRELTEVLRI